MGQSLGRSDSQAWASTTVFGEPMTFVVPYKEEKEQNPE